jgi:hypothetical protein
MEANMYLLELIVGVAVPIVLLSMKGTRYAGKPEQDFQCQYHGDFGNPAQSDECRHFRHVPASERIGIELLPFLNRVCRDRSIHLPCGGWLQDCG